MAAQTTTEGLAAALLAFQAEAPTLPKDATNPHFKSRYTPLDTIVETIKPLLAKHGLIWTTLPGIAETGQPCLNYRLLHAGSGEALDGCMPLLLAKQDSQALGSALTYGRRYALTAVLNLVADEDDDGNSASQRQSNGHASQPTAEPAQQGPRPASAKQRNLINARAGEAGLPASVLANIVRHAMDQEPREFAAEEDASAWLTRYMDRLPASKVDQVLENIGAEQVAS